MANRGRGSSSGEEVYAETDPHLVRALPPRDEPTFAAGALLAERYGIVRFLAIGGMGEVYEAHDTTLRERVALKTIRPEIAGKPDVVERFKREIYLARRVTHVNVCRIFDVDFHELAGGPRIPFFTMEMLDGETLAARLAREGKMSVAEARPVVEQMVAALAAAHREGIVHRDFKPGNVILVDARAVVTDFGLARAPGPGKDPFTSLTGNAGIVGSPAYMAPEQVDRSSGVTPRTDIYALGVVMYEMMTGRVPFTGPSPLGIAVARLKAPPSPPKLHNPSLDLRWEAAILRCLEREPEGRFQHAAEVVVALDRDLTEPVVRAAPKPLRIWPSVAIAAVLGAAVAGGIATWLARREPRPAAPVATFGARRSVAVLGFAEPSGHAESAWIGGALGRIVIRELAGGGDLRAVGGERIVQAKRELALADADGYAASTLAELRRRVGADAVVTGSILAGKEIRVDLRVQETAGGTTLLVASESAPEDRLGELGRRVAARVRRVLGAVEPSPADEARIAASLPANPAAARAFAEGMARLRVADCAGARDRLRHATEADATFALGFEALSEAEFCLGGDQLTPAKRALELSSGLAREEQLFIEARLRWAAGETERSIGLYKELFRTGRDSVEWGYRLCLAQFLGGKEGDALVSLEALREVAGAEDDARVIELEMRAAMWRQEYRRALEIGERSLALAEAQGELHVIAEARSYQTQALWFLGELDRALDAAREWKRVAATSGDRDDVADALGMTGYISWTKGAISDGQLAVREAVKLDSEEGERPDLWLALNAGGALAQQAGDLAEAERSYAAGAAASLRAGSRFGDALGAMGSAIVAYRQGKLDEARRTFEALLPSFRIYFPKHNLGMVLSYLGATLYASGQLALARDRCEEALALREEIGEAVWAAESQTALAEIAIDEGRAGDAVGLSEKAAKAYLTAKVPDGEARARAALAVAKSRSGSSDGRAEIVRAMELSSKSEDAWVKGRVAEAAFVVGAPGAAKLLEEALADANRRGLVEVQGRLGKLKH